MFIVLDTTFFVMHYFSQREDVVRKSKAVLQSCRTSRNRGIVPTIVLAEFYATTRKKAGRDIAEGRFREVADSGLELAELSQEIAKESAVLRLRYQEKIPWGDCIIAGTAITREADAVLSEDPHFKQIREIKSNRLADLRL